MALTIPYGGLGVIRAWTEHGYYSVPVYEFISHDESNWKVVEFEHDLMRKVSTLEDQTRVHVFDEVETVWGKYVQVVSNVMHVSGWVAVWDVRDPDE